MVTSYSVFICIFLVSLCSAYSAHYIELVCGSKERQGVGIVFGANAPPVEPLCLARPSYYVPHNFSHFLFIFSLFNPPYNPSSREPFVRNYNATRGLLATAKPL